MVERRDDPVPQPEQGDLARVDLVVPQQADLVDRAADCEE
jgi:hypothetical protein